MHELSPEGQIRYECGDSLFELRAGESEMPTLVGHFAVFDQWTEINSRWEGRFMERIAPGAFAKTFQERGDQIKVLFDHGHDPSIGNKPLGRVRSLGEDERGAAYEVDLFDSSYVRDLLPALEAGQLGASFRFRAMKEDFPLDPAEPSDHNPDGLRERTITEMKVMEFGPVTFPAYDGASAGLRSATDWWHEQNLRSQLEQFATTSSNAESGFNVVVNTLEGAAALEPEATETAPVDSSRSTRSRVPLRAQKGVYRLP